MIPSEETHVKAIQLIKIDVKGFAALHDTKASAAAPCGSLCQDDFFEEGRCLAASSDCPAGKD